MKKVAILTSVLVLAACGGGSGGGDGVYTGSRVSGANQPNYHIPSNSERTANTNNTNLTGMASEVMVTEDRQGTINFVTGALGSDVYNTTTLSNISSRNATRRDAGIAGGRALTDDEKYYIAYNKVEKMEKTLKALDSLSGAEFDAYVDAHKADVIEAFKLVGQSGATEDSDFTALLDTVKGGGTIEAAIETVKPYSTVKIDDVEFKFAGEDRYAKFVIDDSGVITKIAQMNSDDTITEQGYFTRDTDAKGKLKTTFSKQMKEWSFNLGDWDGNEWFAGISGGKGNITTLTVLSDTDSEPTKEQMKAKVTAAINRFISGQNGSPAASEAREAILAHYTNLIDTYAPNAETPVDFNRTSKVIDYSVELNGLGTGLGLKYSDFGYAKMTETPTGGTAMVNYSPYSGGYDDLTLASIESMTADMKFKGKAVAGVEMEDDRGTGTSASVLLVDNDALLTLDKNGNKHTLEMNNLKDTQTGADWYSVKIIKDDTGLDMTFDTDDKTIASNIAFDTVDSEGVLHHKFTTGWVPSEGRYENYHDENTNYGGQADFQYYSPDKTQVNTAEVGGTFHFSEMQHWGTGDDETHKEVSMYGAFGGKKQ